MARACPAGRGDTDGGALSHARSPPNGASAITVTFPDPATHPALYAVVLAIVATLLIARRVPLVRRIVSVATWLLLAAVLVLVLNQRAAFDPYLARLAGALRLDRQDVVGRETRVKMSPDGHFWVRATLNGVPRRLLVDSGATVTALDPATAAAAGLKTERPLVPVMIRTANGTIGADTATIAELRLGNIVARDLPVIVAPGMSGIGVIGMNFLSRLAGWRVENGELILTPHHPQEPAAG